MLRVALFGTASDGKSDSSEVQVDRRCGCVCAQHGREAHNTCRQARQSALLRPHGSKHNNAAALPLLF